MVNDFYADSVLKALSQQPEENKNEETPVEQPVETTEETPVTEEVTEKKETEEN